MDAQEFQRLLDTVAEQVSATDYFPLNQPENDLHPDPRSLRDEIVTLRYRITDLERRFNEFLGTQSNVRSFPNR